MTAPLNLQPVGLLDFLGIKNGGRYPEQLSTVLQGCLELLPLYESNARQIYAALASGAASAGVTQFGPAGGTTEPSRVWHFHQVSVTINATSAGAVWYGALGIWNPHPAPGTFIALTDGGYAQNAAAPTQITLATRDFWLPPPWSLALNTYGLSAAPTWVAAWRASTYNF